MTDDRQYLSWDDYLKRSFGMIEGMMCLCQHSLFTATVLSDRDQIHDKNRNLTYREVITRYERRYRVADKDGNQLLDKDEFADFLHPRELAIEFY